jgi:hypothetical protein
MRTLLYAIVVFLMLPTALSAAPKKNMNDVRKFKTELNLTNAQMTQLDKIYGDYKSKAKLQAPLANKKAEIMNKMAMRKELRKQVAKVLTTAQRQKIMEMRAANAQ